MNECYVQLQCPFECATANFDFFSRHKGHLTCFISYYCNIKLLFISGALNFDLLSNECYVVLKKMTFVVEEVRRNRMP